MGRVRLLPVTLLGRLVHRHSRQDPTKVAGTWQGAVRSGILNFYICPLLQIRGRKAEPNRGLETSTETA